MKLLILLIAIVAAASAVPAKHVLKFSKSLSPRIISGSPAYVGQFKYQVGLIYGTSQGTFLCGGALLNSRWVLTAAHCVEGAFYFDAFMGGIYSDSTWESGKQTVRTSTSIAHGSYESVTYQNDIALINLNTDIRFTDSVQPISLGSQHIGGGNRLTVSGWGQTSDWSAQSRTLMWVQIDSITNDECSRTYRGIFEGSLCCKGNPEHSTCHGDSGGPLVTYDSNGVPLHVGVVSFGDERGCALGSPSVYARTEYFIQWINNNMRN